MDSDLIIVGSGIIGLTSAYHIKRQNPDLSITIIDKAPTYSQGNTGKSAAAFRNLFTTSLNYSLSNSSIDFYRHIQEDLGFNIGMKFTGYLFLVTHQIPGWSEILEERGLVKWMELDEIFEGAVITRKPSPDASDIIGLDEITGGFFGQKCGIMEPDLLSAFYYGELKRMGVDFQFNTEVRHLNLVPTNPLNYPGEPYIWQDKTIGGIETNRGTFRAEKYILATGVWTTSLLDPLGIDSHIRPRKRQIFRIGGENIKKILYSSKLNPDRVAPFIVLPHAGVYIRPNPKENSIWVSASDNIGRDFSFTEDPLPEREFYDLNLRPVLEAYFPAFSSARVDGSWAGYYAYNTINRTPYIFRSLNVIVATGTSGSGILKGDSIGRIVSAVYSGDEQALLYDGSSIEVDKFGIENHSLERELVVL